MKDEEDADLALNVVSSLASSLREYYTKNKEKKIAEVSLISNVGCHYIVNIKRLAWKITLILQILL